MYFIQVNQTSLDCHSGKYKSGRGDSDEAGSAPSRMEFNVGQEIPPYRPAWLGAV